MEAIAMPQLGETVTEGTITAWSKAVGDEVAVDDALFEVSTEKVDTEVPSAFAGFLRAILVPEGHTVPVGTVVAILTATAHEPYDEPATAPAPAPVARPERAAAPERSPVPAGPAGRSEPAGVVRSPVVRRLLAEHHLTPDEVVGSGRDGRITRADVLAAVAQGRAVDGRPARPAALAGDGRPGRPVAPAVAGPADEVVWLSKARRNTAANMLQSLATAAHTLVATEVDYTAVDAVRREAGLSFLPFVARALVDAIADYPHVNASMGDGELIVHRPIHLGVAVDLDHEALVVPVVHDAGDLRLAALAEAVADLADRARRKRATADDLAGGTVTLTNVGAYGTLITAPIINQPQVAILSTDGVKMRPVAVPVDGGWGVAVHPVGNLCLSFDHRAFDGAYASAFLARVRTLLEERDWAEELGP